MDILSEENPKISTIKTKSHEIITTSQLTTIKEIKNSLNDNKIPYPNKEQIPLLKIKNENYFESGENIGNYLKNLVKFEDDKFNKCSICKKYLNYYFCENCYKNICDICYKNCSFNNHVLIDLKEKSKEINNLIINIRLIFSNCFLLYNKK